MSKYRMIYIVESLIVMALGIFCMVAPYYSTWKLELLLGWVLTFAGGIQLLRLFTTTIVPPAGGYIASALLYLFCGIILLMYPHAGILSIAFIILMLFLLEGGVKLFLGAQLYPLRSWKWMVLNGLLSWSMVVITWRNWPEIAFSLPGLMMGINLFYYGLVLLGISLKHHPQPQMGESSSHLR